MHSYILETDRLILRPVSPDDAEAAFVWLSDPEVNRFMPYNLYESVEQAREWLTGVTLDESPELTFAIVRKEDNLVIGSCGIGPDDTGSTWEFGYNLRQDCWNKGYATETAREMIRFAHEAFGVRDFAANHAVDNPASGRVMEHCGLTFDHYGEYSTFDKTQTFKAKFYRMHIE